MSKFRDELERLRKIERSLKWAQIGFLEMPADMPSEQKKSIYAFVDMLGLILDGKLDLKAWDCASFVVEKLKEPEDVF